MNLRVAAFFGNALFWNLNDISLAIELPILVSISLFLTAVKGFETVWFFEFAEFEGAFGANDLVIAEVAACLTLHLLVTALLSQEKYLFSRAVWI